MTVDDGRDLPNDPFGPNFFPLLQTLASEGLQLQTAMEFDSIDRMLRSRALKDPSKFLEQANAILSSNLESTNFKDTSCRLPEDSNQTGDVNGVDNEHKRRPALGLRRAKFSFKPIQSQPVLLPDPVLSIDHLKDPDEFFAACERLENAEKELKKSRGKTLEGPVEKPKDRKLRLRRQGILGKMASYKHIYPKSAVEVNPVSSQEEMSQVSQFNTTLEAESNKSKPESATQPTESHEAETVDIEVVAPKEKQDSQINILLEELLSTCVDLDGGEMVSLLQERLHVKPVALDELSFPDLDRNDIKAFEGSQSQPRKALADLKQGLRLTVSCKTPVRKTSVKKQNKDESFRYPRSSSTPPRSPFASFSRLTKRILQIDQPSDRFAFSVEPDGQAAERSCSFEGRVDKEDFLCPASPIHLEKGSLGSSDDSTQRNVGKANDEMLSKMDEECNAENIAFSSKKVSLMDLAVPLDTPMEVDAYPKDKVKDLPPMVPLSQELEISLDVVTGTAQCSKDQPEPVDTYMDNTSSGFDNDIDAIPSEVHAHSRDKVNDMPTVVSSSQELESSNVVITGTAQCRDSQLEPAKCSEDRPESGTCLAADGHPEGTTDFFGLHDKSQEASSTVSQNKREVNGLRGKRTKKRQHRQSLAAAGTNFESGTRKSTRVKSRPLEYWRGERFLYGRIHESLPTVIGIKKASPGKSGAEPLLKVESFVSDEYAELIRLSALH